MVSSVSSSSVSPPHHTEDRSSPYKDLAIKVLQLAVRVLFVFSAILMAAALTPAAYTAVVVAPVAVGAAFLAASFFPSSIPLEPSLGTSIASSPEIPRGIKNISNNCWLNADLQLFLSSKWASDFIRKSSCLPNTLLPLREFYKAYDRTIEEGKKIVDFPSQKIREMVASFSNTSINSSSSKQEDAHEGFSSILDQIISSAPASFYRDWEIQERTSYNTQGLPPLPDYPSGVSQKTQLTSILSLPISTPNLDQMLKDYFHEIPDDVYITPNQVDFYRAENIERQYTRAPRELWIHIKRFSYDFQTEVTSKNSIEIQIPDTITIQPVEGESTTYRLNAHVNHLGSYGGGHYVAYRESAGKWYCCNDSWVTLMDLESLKTARSEAYLLHYEKMD